MTYVPKLVRCGAKTQRGKGPPCERYAMANGKCYLHGGKSLSGAAVNKFTFGRYSKYMPQEIFERYQTAMEDQTLLDLTSEIALVDTRLATLMERVEVPDVFGTLRRLRDILGSLGHKDEERRASAIEYARDLLDATRNDAHEWEQIFKLIEARRKLVESERKRRIETNTTMTIEELVNTATALANLALRYIPEGNAQRGYIDDVSRIFQLQREGTIQQDIHVSPDSIAAGHDTTMAE